MTKPPHKASSATTPLSPSPSPPTADLAPPAAPTPGKLERMILLLQRPEGASLAELVEATGWQPHSVRGALAAGIPKKVGRKVTSEKIEGVRRYWLPDEAAQ